MHLFSQLKQEVQEYLPPDQIDRIYRAYQFAAKAHAGQQRHSGDPYITHPLAVAKILAQMHMDTQTLIVALLHDVIEDTAIEKNSLVTTFGSEIADLVDGMSKLTKIQFQSRAEAQAENFRKMLLAMAKDIRIILIKLADRLHNMRTLSVVPSEKRQRIARESLDIYAPIAQRLGMHALRVELEDLCLFNLHPWRYNILQPALQKARKKRKPLINKIEAEMKAAFEKNHLHPTAIWHKKKHIYPIYKKMSENHLGFNEIIDIPIFCILVENVDTCYRVLGALHNLYKPLPDHFQDYIALPKANGYQALHTTLFGPNTSIHVQIRTNDMEKCAEHGIVSYWLDQNKKSGLKPHLRAREWLKRLLDIQKTTSSSLEFIETVKIDLIPADIYIFTPKGDIIELPQKSTPIDFAYAIHSDVGNHCVTVKIDQLFAPLSTTLQSGQTVEIMTDPQALPDLRWLDFVATGRARSHIRQFFKTKQHNEAVQLGQRLLDNTLIPLGKDSTHLSPKYIAKTLNKFDYASFKDLLEAIGLGYTHPSIIAKSLTNLKSTAKKDNSSGPLPLFIKNTENSLITFSECCRPIPDDEIVGLLNAGHGLTVHVHRCKYAVRLLKKNKDRGITVQWEKISGGFYKTDLYIETLNQCGVLALLTHSIAKAKSNIDNIKVENNNREHSVIHFTLFVKNRKHLATIIRFLRTTKAIVKITRHRALFSS